MLRAQTFVFFAVDVPHRLTRGPLFIVDVQGFDQAFDQTYLVITVEDLEILWQIGV